MPSRTATSTRASCRSATKTARWRSTTRNIPRPQTTLEGLAALKPSFEAMADFALDRRAGTTYRGLIRQVYPDLEINHVHHAGNSSGVVDGAAALLLASPTYAQEATA